jgi:hypothetical protein
MNQLVITIANYNDNYLHIHNQGITELSQKEIRIYY